MLFADEEHIAQVNLNSEDKVLKKKPSRAKSVKKPGSTSKNKSTKNSKKDPEPPV